MRKLIQKIIYSLKRKMLLDNQILNIQLISRINEAQTNVDTFKLLLTAEDYSNLNDLKKLIEVFNQNILDGVQAQDLYNTVWYELKLIKN